MIKTTIIGLGKISHPHIMGLKNNADKYEIVGMCDSLRSLENIAKEHGVPFFEHHKEAVSQENVDLVVILTPPSTHYEIAKDALLNKKHVLIEKPGVLEMDHLYELVDLAKQNNVTIDVMFHWQFGSEVLAIENKLHTFGKLRRIESNAFDPYTLTDQKTIEPSVVSLNGAWSDSGINILSLLTKFLDIRKLKLNNEYIEYDTTNELPIYIEKRFDYEDIKVDINIEWRENKNHKYTNFFFEEGTLFVHHTAQEIWFNTDRVESFYNEHRLITHYTNLFKHTELTMDNIDSTIALHEVLLSQK